MLEFTPITDANTGDNIVIESEGFDYWLKLQFGSSYTIGLSLFDARKFADELRTACDNVEAGMGNEIFHYPCG